VGYGLSIVHFLLYGLCREPAARALQRDFEKEDRANDSILGEHSAIENGSSDHYLETDCDRSPAPVASETTSRCARPQTPALGNRSVQGTLTTGEWFGLWVTSLVI